MEQSPAEWLKEFRAKDKTNWVTIEFDVEDNDMDNIVKAAEVLDMELEEFFAYATEKYINDKTVGYCETCHATLFTFATPCYHCGEING